MKSGIFFHKVLRGTNVESTGSGYLPSLSLMIIPAAPKAVLHEPSKLSLKKPGGGATPTNKNRRRRMVIVGGV